MEVITKEQLIEDGIKHSSLRGEVYFDADAVFEKYRDARINPNIQLEKVDFGEESYVALRAEDFYILSEFDKMMLKTRKTK